MFSHFLLTTGSKMLQKKLTEYGSGSRLIAMEPKTLKHAVTCKFEFSLEHRLIKKM